MTVAELKTALEPFDDKLDVYINLLAAEDDEMEIDGFEIIDKVKLMSVYDADGDKQKIVVL